MDLQPDFRSKVAAKANFNEVRVLGCSHNDQCPFLANFRPFLILIICLVAFSDGGAGNRGKGVRQSILMSSQAVGSRPVLFS